MAERKIICARCGKETVAKGTSMKYCPDCGYQVRMEKVALYREALRVARGVKDEKAKKPGKTKRIKCQRCGAEVEVPARASRAKFCPKCSQESKNESVKRSKARAKEEPPTLSVTTVCKRCGVTFSYEYKKYERAFCDDCKDANNGRKKEPKKKARVSRIDDIQRAAQAAGMSYGKYMALLSMRKMKKGA